MAVEESQRRFLAQVTGTGSVQLSVTDAVFIPVEIPS